MLIFIHCSKRVVHRNTG